MTIYLSNPIKIILARMKILPLLVKKKVKSRVGRGEEPTLLSMGNEDLNSWDNPLPKRKKEDLLNI